MEKLKPCPFCGGEANMKQNTSKGFIIKCTKCHIQIRQKVLRFSLEWLEGKMIEHWNTRYSDTILYKSYEDFENFKNISDEPRR